MQLKRQDSSGSVFHKKEEIVGDFIFPFSRKKRSSWLSMHLVCVPLLYTCKPASSRFFRLSAYKDFQKRMQASGLNGYSFTAHSSYFPEHPIVSESNFETGIPKCSGTV